MKRLICGILLLLLLTGCVTKPAEEGPKATDVPQSGDAPQSTQAPVVIDEGPDDVAIELVPAGNVIDKYTKDITVYFDDGVFLGSEKDNICHLNTYVSNQHLYTNQRLMSRKLQDNIEELFKKL